MRSGAGGLDDIVCQGCEASDSQWHAVRHEKFFVCLRSPSFPLPPAHATTHHGISIGNKELPDCLAQKQTV